MVLPPVTWLISIFFCLQSWTYHPWLGTYLDFCVCSHGLTTRGLAHFCISLSAVMVLPPVTWLISGFSCMQSWFPSIFIGSYHIIPIWGHRIAMKTLAHIWISLSAVMVLAHVAWLITGISCLESWFPSIFIGSYHIIPIEVIGLPWKHWLISGFPCPQSWFPSIFIGSYHIIPIWGHRIAIKSLVHFYFSLYAVIGSPWKHWFI